MKLESGRPFEEMMGMVGRIPSGGLMCDVDEGQTESGEHSEISEFGPALGMAIGFTAEKFRRERKHKKCKEKHPNDPKKVQDCMKKGI
jgi:hypothetical protein